jgi:hypothetical protein
MGTMRDPDLMQRADRAAIALEQAWERWRAMHGLGGEPLPPVSSYVGYSLEEPWGQPRVVFGLRADEAEMLASLLDGHDCVGSVYAEVGARLDWRLNASGPAPTPALGYGMPLGVPAQAPPPGIDLLPPGPSDGFVVGPLGDEDPTAVDEPDDDSERRRAPRAAGAGPARGRTTRAGRSERASRRSAGTAADDAEETTERDEADWSVADSELSSADLPDGGDTAESDVSESLLEPLPDEPNLRLTSDEADDEPGAGTPRAAGAGKVTRGPGYRGPRYQGFPPRYDPGPRESPARPEALADEVDDDDIAADVAPVRRSHASKLSRSARRRTQG